MAQGRRVVHVLGRMTPGGIEVWLLRLLKRLDRERFPTSICVVNERPGELEDEVRALGVELVRCPLAAGWRTFRRRLAALLRERNAAVLHSHLFLLSGALVRLARSAGVKTRIAHAHSSRDAKAPTLFRRAYTAWMRRQLSRFCTHWIACSAEAGDFVFGPGWRDRGTAHVMPCGIDVDAFGVTEERSAVRDELGIPPGRRIVGHVGSFRRAKNHAFLIEVFQELVRHDPHLHLVLVGAGDLVSEVRAQVADAQLAAHVTFAGLRSDIPRVMDNAFDLLLLPSLWEGLGVVAVEAQCAGLPCLVSEGVPRTVRVVEDLVEWERLDAGPGRWAERALALLDRPRPPQLAARQAIRDSTFSIESNLRLLTALYEARGTPAGERLCSVPIC